MKKLLFTLLLCMGTMLSALAQNTASDLLNNDRDFLYVTTHVSSKAEVNALARNFSVDNCPFDERTGLYNVRIYLSRHEYSDFLAQNLPFEIIPAERADAPVSTTLAGMANWDKYPPPSSLSLPPRLSVQSAIKNPLNKRLCQEKCPH